MRKLIALFILLSGVNVWAAPLERAQTAPVSFVTFQQTREASSPHLRNSQSFVDNLFQGWPILVGLYVALPLEGMELEEDLPPGQTLENYVMSYFEEFTQEQLQIWFSNALEYIETSGREAEFEDVVPILQQKANLEFVYPGENHLQWAKEVEEFWGKEEDVFTKYDWGSAQKINEDVPLAQVYVVLAYDKEVAEQCGDERDRGCFVPMPQVDSSILVASPVAKWSLRHEWGHLLGLEDLYEGSHSRPPVGEAVEGIMNNSKTLTCADADAMIFLMDRWMVQNIRVKDQSALNSYFSARIVNGWDSFCQTGRRYFPLKEK